jgi:hypothetical protein
MSTAATYQIRVAGLLDPSWSEWFEGLTLSFTADETTLTGPLPDQAALHGVLNKIRDLGLVLLSVSVLADGPADGPAAGPAAGGDSERENPE